MTLLQGVAIFLIIVYVWVWAMCVLAGRADTLAGRK